MKQILTFIALAISVAASVGASAETLLERGTYLMGSIGACGNCHTAPGGPFKDKELAGGLKWDEKPFTTYATNITQDRETGIGAWSDDEIILAFREGMRPRGGRIIGPPMPIGLYRSFSDRDAKAIVAYLKTVNSVKRKMPDANYRIPLPPRYGPPLRNVADIPRSNKVAYGEYLAKIGHCIECHTPQVRGRRDFSRTGAGGQVFHGPWGESTAANITPDKKTGIGNWSATQIKGAIFAGVRADGTKLRPPMPFSYYKNINNDDLDALVAYLRSLKPINNATR